jgi:hypothetical protein
MKKVRVSASQISLFKRCKRAWYYRYIEKIKVPVKPWLKKGIEFHDCIENMYRKINGEDIKDEIYGSDIIDMVKAGFENNILYVPNKFIPEKQIDFDISDAASMTGKIDLVDVSNSKIVDHKTISNKKWALTPSQLREDLQLNIYGYWYLTTLPKKKFVWYRHNQLNKTNPDMSMFQEVKVSRNDVIDYWKENVEPEVEEIVELKQQANKELFKCNLTSCDDYGGCDYLHCCDKQV